MTLATIKKDVLSTIKYLVPHSLYSAVSILFSKCCDLEVTISQACPVPVVDPLLHNITITVKNSVSNPTGVVVATLGGLSFPGATISADGKTITITGASLPAGNYVFAGALLYATNASQLVGAYKFFTCDSIAVVNCV